VSLSVVVDGYNVRSLLDDSLERARERLVERLATLAQMTDVAVAVVFDAARGPSPRGSEEVRDGVRVVFTGRGSSADHTIERMAYRARREGESLVVATSDRLHRDLLRGMGAAVIDPGQLRRQVEDAERDLERRLRAYDRRSLVGGWQ
jgi:predicted RNA-binding protein with PIN domain